MTMNTRKFLISLVLAISILIVQVGGVFAAPTLQAFPPITGTVCSITLDTDPNTGITTVIVEVEVVCMDQAVQKVRISQKTGEKLGLVAFDGDGKPVINTLALGQSIEIKLTMVIPDKEEYRNPLGNALETFFSGIADYNTIMEEHSNGFGFGVIAQALWLTKEMGGNSDDFQALLSAKQNNDYSNIILDDGTTPQNWGQLSNAILGGKKVTNLGVVMSNKDNNENGNNKDQNKDHSNNKDKNKNNNGNSNGNGNGNNK